MKVSSTCALNVDLTELGDEFVDEIVVWKSRRWDLGEISCTYYLFYEEEVSWPYAYVGYEAVGPEVWSVVPKGIQYNIMNGTQQS